MKLYLLIVWHDVEPSLEGPYTTNEARNERAREIRASSDEHGLYALNTEGAATIDVELDYWGHATTNY